jgi:hypothetical protein
MAERSMRLRSTRQQASVAPLMLLLAMLLSGCADNPLQPYVPAHCHGAAEPFDSYTLEYVEVPGFIVSDIDTSLQGALARQGLEAAGDPAEADVRIVSRLRLIDHNAPPLVDQPRNSLDSEPDNLVAGPLRDPFGQSMGEVPLNRFVTHLSVEIFDLRSGDLIWVGSIDRAHAITGGETFHGERAILQISNAFDEMFQGLTTPCT